MATTDPVAGDGAPVAKTPKKDPNGKAKSARKPHAKPKGTPTTPSKTSGPVVNRSKEWGDDKPRIKIRRPVVETVPGDEG